MHEVLEFWFGKLEHPWRFPEQRADLWFRNGRAYDADIRDRFGQLHRAAGAGELEHWTDTAEGLLALIILLDQFSRHVHRGTAQAFGNDAKARELCLTGLKAHLDETLHPVQRTFMYLPLEHAEDLYLQRKSVALYEGLQRGLAPDAQESYASSVDYAMRHLRIIERFGRFPHRNAALGRESTRAERQFLQQPGSSF